jgi:prevent-host-death family protein
MPSRPDPFDIDLQQGVVPISKATAALTALIRLSHGRQLPVLVTQNGYPSAVLLGIDLSHICL